jgi:nucleotide-binding universal stress UspA family protein
MFRTIVAGTDGHEKGRNAVVLAHELAWATGARLLLVAVHPHGPTQPIDLVRRLRALRNELAPAALVLSVPDASPADGLCRVADEQGADLIVVGATERGRLRRVIEGEPGMQVLRGAPCAVAVAPDDAPEPRVLARIGASADALDPAGTLAHRSGGRVIAVAPGEEATARLDVLVVGPRGAGDVRKLLTEVRCPVLVAPVAPAVLPAVQASVART